MKLEIHHYHHYPELANVSEHLDNLTNEVAAMRGVVQSATTLIDNLANQIEQLQNDPAALQALADDLRAQKEGLAAAVDANDGDDTTPAP